MIRRISKHNDLRDIVRSCPSGVIDDIYSIKYYIQGYDEEIEVEFSKVGRQLEVIIPTSKLELLPNGILMRRAYYRVADTSYPDGYYNLEFEDNMNIWLGDDEVDPYSPVGDYVTEDELSSTLSSYATQEWISSQGYLTAETLPSDIATEEWVASQGYLSAVPSEYATQSWVEGQGYLSAVPSEYATQSWVEGQGYVTSENMPSGLATQSWVEGQGYLTSVPSGYATESWVEGQGYLTSHQDLTGYATESWVESQGYLTSHQDLTGYATESWVSSQGYLTSVPSGYATESWVASQGYLTAVPSEYATQSWATSEFLEESKVWVGSRSAWEALTSAQQTLYTIALIVQS